jgi:Asp-tRNA(Asn)/Glu-tRNA(Gln) amidotransferase A subunit family amidase/enoyl-CoA hydratase/carnithine racemase
LVAAYESRALSPVDVTREILDRITGLDGQLNSYVTVTPELALAQAHEAEVRYGRGDTADMPLLGIPISIKDLFDVRGVPTSLGSLAYRGTIAARDSQPVARLVKAGGIILGKTNTAEFGQSATTENLLGPGCGNPWDPSRTAGGSSGGAGASVGAGLATAALASDGGGSIRIPAAMCGMFGLKPTVLPSGDKYSFEAMSELACPGPIARRTADARTFLEALLGRRFARIAPRPRRVAWCPGTNEYPVDPELAEATSSAVERLAGLGHEVEEIPLPIENWLEAFGPFALQDEWRHRRHLLEDGAEELTVYARRAIEAARNVSDEDVEVAWKVRSEIRETLARLFERFDFIVTPSSATVAFPIGERPTEIAGQRVNWTWGAFPFTARFNVSGSPAASLPCGFADGMPVGLHVVGPDNGEAGLLDFCEELEDTFEFPVSELATKWQFDRTASSRSRPVEAGGAEDLGQEISAARRDTVSLISISRPSKRNALTRSMLKRLRELLGEEAADGQTAIVLTGSGDVFSSGMDLAEVGRGADDVQVDESIGELVDAIRSAPIPIVAAIEGPCVGAAVEIATACDVRIAGEGAWFQLPAARLGVLYRPQGVEKLMADLGRQTTNRLLVLSERITAADALSSGMVAQVVTAGTAAEDAIALASGVEGSVPQALGATKELIAQLADGSSDLSSWEKRRREILSSGERAAALESAKYRLSGAGAKGQGSP